jgi:hypothetical protein
MAQQVPSQVFMGGSRASQDGISMTTAWSLGGISVNPRQVPSLASTIRSVLVAPAPLQSISRVLLVADSSLSYKPSVPCPPTLIKNKPLNISIKDIINKESWMDAKKIIDLCLRSSPFWPHPTSKALVTTKENSLASAWWEELLHHCMKPPVSNLFVRESYFDSKEEKSIKLIQVS